MHRPRPGLPGTGLTPGITLQNTIGLLGQVALRPVGVRCTWNLNGSGELVAECIFVRLAGSLPFFTGAILPPP